MGGGTGLRVGFININDMYNNDVGKGVVYAYEAYEGKKRVAAFRAPVCFIKKKNEAYEAKKRVAAFRAPVCFINFGLIPDRHRYCTYLYYWCV